MTSGASALNALLVGFTELKKATRRRLPDSLEGVLVTASTWETSRHGPRDLSGSVRPEITWFGSTRIKMRAKVRRSLAPQLSRSGIVESSDGLGERLDGGRCGSSTCDLRDALSTKGYRAAVIEL
jgi:hypothetical protein